MLPKTRNLIPLVLHQSGQLLVLLLSHRYPSVVTFPAKRVVHLVNLHHPLPLLGEVPHLQTHTEVPLLLMEAMLHQILHLLVMLLVGALLELLEHSMVLRSRLTQM